MTDVLDSVGWVAAMPVLAEDLLQLETNIDNAIKGHVHGDGTVVAVDPALVPLTGAVGGSATLAAHVANESVHYKPNTNLPNWFAGSVQIPALDGSNPTYSVDVTFTGFNDASYRVFADIHYPQGSVIDNLPDALQITTEVLTATTFRLHLRGMYNPYDNTQSLYVSWLAIGQSASSELV